MSEDASRATYMSVGLCAVVLDSWYAVAPAALSPRSDCFMRRCLGSCASSSNAASRSGLSCGSEAISVVNGSERLWTWKQSQLLSARSTSKEQGEGSNWIRARWVCAGGSSIGVDELAMQTSCMNRVHTLRTYLEVLGQRVPAYPRRGQVNSDVSDDCDSRAQCTSCVMLGSRVFFNRAC